MRLSSSVLALAFSLLSSWLSLQSCRAQDPVADRFEELKQSYRAAIERAEGELFDALDEALANLDPDDATSLKQLQSQRVQFEKWKELPSHSAVAQAVGDFESEANRLHQKMREVYEQAVAHYTRAIKLDEATRIRDELENWDQSLPDYVDREEKVRVQDVLSRAEEDQYDDYLNAQRVLREELDRRLKQAAQKADLDEAKLYQALLEELDATAVLEDIPNTLTAAYNKYIRACEASVERLELTLRKELGIAQRVKDQRRAEEIGEKLLAGVGVGPQRWTTLFRSADPTLWNTDYSGPKGVAMSLDSAPQDIRFLRMRRMDTGESIIIDIEAPRLGSMFFQNSVGWEGRCEKQRDFYRLGIFVVHQNESPIGFLTVSRIGFRPMSGWGFATFHNQDDRQGYAWEGREIPKTPFEIAVTGDMLQPTEQRRRLGSN